MNQSEFGSFFEGATLEDAVASVTYLVIHVVRSLDQESRNKFIAIVEEHIDNLESPPSGFAGVTGIFRFVLTQSQANTD